MANNEQEKSDYKPLCKLPEVPKPEEYRIGEHKPPVFLVILFILVFIWAMISWIPFFGY
jgi:hypothetical protein